MKVASIVIGSVLCLAGCAPVYQARPVESRALLRLSPAIHIFQYFDNGEDCTEPRRFTGSNPYNRENRTLPIPSGRRIGLKLFVVGSGPSLCDIILSFIPQTGRLYDAQMELRGDRCYASIVEPNRDPADTAIEISIKQMKQGFGSCSYQNK